MLMFEVWIKYDNPDPTSAGTNGSPSFPPTPTDWAVSDVPLTDVIRYTFPVASMMTWSLMLTLNTPPGRNPTDVSVKVLPDTDAFEEEIFVNGARTVSATCPELVNATGT